MNTHPTAPRFTADAFIEWAREQPRGRYELAGGEVVAMAPERAGHARVKLSAVNAVAASLKAANLPCEAMVDGMAVRIDEHTVYEPDVLVRCGARTPDDVVVISDPIILVEVVSPSSRAIDSGAKLTGYFRLPSLRHYLVVNIDGRAVTHHQRCAAGDIATRILRDGALVLDPPGATVAVADFFAAL